MKLPYGETFLNAPCDAVKGVLENFHANIPHFSETAFPRCENTGGGKGEEGKRGFVM